MRLENIVLEGSEKSPRYVSPTGNQWEGLGGFFRREINPAESQSFQSREGNECMARVNPDSALKRVPGAAEKG